MATRAVMREDGVLKLVHLGGYVELYWEPITAHEVMEKNPHHSVARPDFWRYPWIVIQPESVLKPGRIFYIIPNHVISDLIKAYRLRNQLSSTKQRNQHPRQSPKVEAGAEVNPIHRDHGRFHLKQPPVEARAEMAATEQVSPRRVEMNHEQHSPIRHLMQKLRNMSCAKMTDTGQDHDQFLKELIQFDSCCEMVPRHGKGNRSLKLFPESSSWVDSWLGLTTKKQHLRHGLKGESLDDSWLEVRPPLPSEYGFGGAIPTKQDQNDFQRCHQVQAARMPCLRSQSVKFGECREQVQARMPCLRSQSVKFGECREQVQARKSCLRTQSANFGRKLDGRRVTFALPGKEQKESEFVDFQMSTQTTSCLPN